MKKNMGGADRTIRTIAAIVIGVFILTGRLHGALAIIFGVIAVAFLVTSLFGYCPAYVPMKLTSLKPGGPAKK